MTITYQVGNGDAGEAHGDADGGRPGPRLAPRRQPGGGAVDDVPAASPRGGPATSPITSINYKSVGLNVDANRVYIQGNKARMELNVEFSAVDEKVSDSKAGYPSFPTFSQSLTLVLESGKPVIVGQSSDVVDNVERRQTVEVKATILR